MLRESQKQFLKLTRTSSFFLLFYAFVFGYKADPQASDTKNVVVIMPVIHFNSEP